MSRLEVTKHPIKGRLIIKKLQHVTNGTSWPNVSLGHPYVIHHSRDAPAKEFGPEKNTAGSSVVSTREDESLGFFSSQVYIGSILIPIPVTKDDG